MPTITRVLDKTAVYRPSVRGKGMWNRTRDAEVLLLGIFSPGVWTNYTGLDARQAICRNSVSGGIFR